MQTNVITTPVSEIPASVKAQVASNDSPDTIDLLAVIKEVAANKGRNGSFSLTKGNGLDSSVCAIVKSRCGIAKDGRLPDDCFERIRRECKAFKATLASKVHSGNIVKSIPYNGIIRGVVKQVIVNTGHNDIDDKEKVAACLTEINKLDNAIVKAELASKPVDNMLAKRKTWIAALVTAKLNCGELPEVEAELVHNQKVGMTEQALIIRQRVFDRASGK